jgi:hypothetical protein
MLENISFGLTPRDKTFYCIFLQKKTAPSWWCGFFGTPLFIHPSAGIIQVRFDGLPLCLLGLSAGWHPCKRKTQYSKAISLLSIGIYPLKIYILTLKLIHIILLKQSINAVTVPFF